MTLRRPRKHPRELLYFSLVCLAIAVILSSITNSDWYLRLIADGLLPKETDAALRFVETTHMLCSAASVGLLILVLALAVLYTMDGLRRKMKPRQRRGFEVIQ